MRVREEIVEGRSSLPLAGAPRRRGEDNERVVAMAPPASALHPLQATAPRLCPPPGRHGGTKRQALSVCRPWFATCTAPGLGCVCGPDHVFL